VLVGNGAKGSGTIALHGLLYAARPRPMAVPCVPGFVADGFVGNVALKISEGVANLVRTALKESLKATITRQVGALLSRSAFTDFKKRLDHTEYGGAPLLGVRGVCIITHGSSNANAMKNAVRVAAEFSQRGINDSIEGGLASLRPSTVETAAQSN